MVKILNIPVGVKSYQNHFIVYDKDLKKIRKTGENGESVYHNCYSTLQGYFNSTNIIDLYIKLEYVRYSKEEIEKYIQILNNIPFFKVSCYFDDEYAYFRLNCKDYDKLSLFKGIMMTIRYIWGDCLNDNISFIPYFTMCLSEKYPKEDSLYLLLLSHVHLNFNNEFEKDFSKYKTQLSWNSNHTLCMQNSFPIRSNELVIDPSLTNNTFSKFEEKDKNQGLDFVKKDASSTTREKLLKLYEENIRCWK